MVSTCKLPAQAFQAKSRSWPHLDSERTCLVAMLPWRAHPFGCVTDNSDQKGETQAIQCRHPHQPAKGHPQGQRPRVGCRVVICAGDAMFASRERHTEVVAKVCQGLTVIISQSWLGGLLIKGLFVIIMGCSFHLLAVSNHRTDFISRSIKYSPSSQHWCYGLTVAYAKLTSCHHSSPIAACWDALPRALLVASLWLLLITMTTANT